MWCLWLVLAILLALGLLLLASIMNQEEAIGCWMYILLLVLAFAFLGSLAFFQESISPDQTGPESTISVIGISLNGATVGYIFMSICALIALFNYPWEFLTGGTLGLFISGLVLAISWLLGDIQSIAEIFRFLFWGTAILAIMLALVKWKNGRPPNDHFGL